MILFLMSGITVSRVFSSDFFFKLNNFLMLLALFGPNLLGVLASVNPGISLSPFWVMVRKRALISFPTIHPLTVFLFLSPVLLGLYKLVPDLRRSLVLPLIKTPYFMAKPYLSFPPIILKV